MGQVVTFGEIMLRLSPPGRQRIRQAHTLELTFGGAEANVAAGLANFGVPVAFVTRLPDNEIAVACLRHLRSFGIDTRFIIRGGQRIGIYFLEHGAVMRPSNVIYDRAGSSFACLEEGMFDWETIFADAGWFHWTGITPAIGPGPAAAVREACVCARKRGVTVSCDLNYRRKLWSWTDAPSDVMAELVSSVDLLVCNEEDAQMVFGIRPDAGDVEAGEVDPQSYRSVAEQLVGRFKNLRTVAITLRGSISADHNRWSAVLWHQGAYIPGPSYDITHIVDRVGAGDAFGAGLIFSVLRWENDPERWVKFATAASALKHTVPGDFSAATVAEVEKVMAGAVSGRVNR